MPKRLSGAEVELRLSALRRTRSVPEAVIILGQQGHIVGYEALAGWRRQYIHLVEAKPESAHEALLRVLAISDRLGPDPGPTALAAAVGEMREAVRGVLGGKA